MAKIQITGMSSRGQIVIPLDIRERLGLKEGEKFVVVADDDTIVLKKIAMPSFKNFDKLLKKTEEATNNNEIAAEEQGAKKTRK